MKYIFHTFSILLLLAANACEAQVKTFRDYYKNGSIQYIKHQGTFMGCGVAVGIDSLFNENGILIETTEYVHLKDQKEQGCHAIMTYVKKTSYKPGNIKPDVRYYKSPYESEPVSCRASDFKNATERSKNK